MILYIKETENVAKPNSHTRIFVNKEWTKKVTNIT
jgi:hypothetical protein